MISHRINFNRVYDSKERVLPKILNIKRPNIEEEIEFWLQLSAQALGACSPMQLADYTYIKRTVAKPYIQKLIETGVLIKIKGEFFNQTINELVVHKDNFSLLQKINDGEITATHTTFLSPFDNIFWAKKRDMQFWGFDQVLEAYKKRKIENGDIFASPFSTNINSLEDLIPN